MRYQKSQKQAQRLLQKNGAIKDRLSQRALARRLKQKASKRIKRVMGELICMKNIVVINDEAHHCYREKPSSSDEDDLKGDLKRKR